MLKVGTAQIRPKAGFLLEGDTLVRAFAQQIHDRLNILAYPRLLSPPQSVLLPALILPGLWSRGFFTDRCSRVAGISARVADKCKKQLQDLEVILLRILLRESIECERSAETYREDIATEHFGARLIASVQ